MPIAQILKESGDWESAAQVTREWCGVSDAPAARDAFCELFEASPGGVASLEFTMDTKGHWHHTLDRGTFDRIIALAAEDRRRSAVLRINLRRHKIGGSCRARVWSYFSLAKVRVRTRTGGLPASISNLTNLQSLDMSHCGLDGASRSTTVQQNRRQLRSESRTGSIPSEIGNLTNLKTLVLAQNRLQGPCMFSSTRGSLLRSESCMQGSCRLRSSA